MVFDRHISSSVELLSDNQARVSVVMCDAFHDIAVLLIVELEEGTILEAQADFIRAPQKECRETRALMPRLKGITLGRGIRVNATKAIGGETGCVHLADLVVEAAKTFGQGIHAINLQDYENTQDYVDKISLTKSVKCRYHVENEKRLAQE